MKFNDVAAGSCSPGTIREIAADRVGELIAKNACWTDNRHSTTHTLLTDAAAWIHSRIDATANPTEAMISSTRRSMASAHAPPQSPKTTSGTSAKIPESPT